MHLPWVSTAFSDFSGLGSFPFLSFPGFLFQLLSLQEAFGCCSNLIFVAVVKHCDQKRVRGEKALFGLHVAVHH